MSPTELPSKPITPSVFIKTTKLMEQQFWWKYFKCQNIKQRISTDPLRDAIQCWDSKLATLNPLMMMLNDIRHKNQITDTPPIPGHGSQTSRRSLLGWDTKSNDRTHKRGATFMVRSLLNLITERSARYSV